MKNIDKNAIKYLAFASFGYLPVYKKSMVSHVRTVADEAVKLGLLHRVKYSRYIGYSYEGTASLKEQAEKVAEALQDNEKALRAAKLYRNLWYNWSKPESLEVTGKDKADVWFLKHPGLTKLI